MPAKEPFSIIVIGAHMDDCWLGAGATCLKAARQGHRVTFVTAITNHQYYPPVKGREAEIHAKCDDLCKRNGIAHVRLAHDYMRLVNEPALVGEVAQVIKDLKGDVLFCHAEDEDNQDHTALGAASRIAALHGECFVKDEPDIQWPWEVYQYTTGWQARTFSPDTFVDVTETLFDALAICNNFDEIYANGKYPTKHLTVTDHTMSDRTAALNPHARFKFAQAISFGTGCYAEGFAAYTRRCLTHRKLAAI